MVSDALGEYFEVMGGIDSDTFRVALRRSPDSKAKIILPTRAQVETVLADAGLEEELYELIITPAEFRVKVIV
jgi:hypothetical protein